MSSLLRFATIQIRRDTAGNWTSENPTPHLGEWCLETDTGYTKLGDGSTAWNSLKYHLDRVFGSMYTNSTIAISLTDQDTWYEADGTNPWTAGELYLSTFTDPGITVLVGGKYEIMWDVSTDFSSTPGSKQEVEGGIMIDGVIQMAGMAHRTLANSTDTGNFTGMAIMALTANQIVSLALRNVTSGGKTLHVEHGNLLLKQIGV